MDPDEFKKSRSYQIDKINLSMASGFFGFCQNMSYLLLGFYPALWAQSGVLLGRFGFAEDSEIAVRLSVGVICFCFYILLYTFHSNR